MSTRIHWQDKTLLRCSNSIFSTLYNNMLDLIYADKILLNHELQALIDRLELCTYGWHINLAEYIKTDQDLLFFIKLTRRALDKYNKECQEWLQGLDDLYKELTKIGESFPENVIVGNNGESTIAVRSEPIVIKRALLEFDEALKESNSILNDNVTEAIKKLLLPNNYDCVGSIMAEYLHTKEEAIVFTDLIGKAALLRKKVNDYAQKVAQDLLEGFYQELLNVPKNFKNL